MSPRGLSLQLKIFNLSFYATSVAIKLFFSGFLHMSVERNEKADEVGKATALDPVNASCPFFLRDLFSFFGSAIQPTLQARWKVIIRITKMRKMKAKAVCHWSNTHVRGLCNDAALTPSSDGPHLPNK